MTRVTFDVNGEGIEHLRALYRPDRYDYRIELSRKQAKGQSSWQHVNEVEFAFEMHQHDISQF